MTGLNEAFFIDGATRQRLIAEDKRSGDLIKPLLRGRDIDRWRPRVSDGFIIFARRGIEIDRYPAVKRHLSQFRDRLEPRPADWNERRDGPWPGRAPGDYAWYELQASPSGGATDATFLPKIVFQEMAWFNRFALDESGAVLANTAYFIPGTDPSILATLNSPVAWWYMWRTAQHGKDEVLRLIGEFMERFPMPPALAGAGAFSELVAMVTTISPTTNADRDRTNLQGQLEIERRLAVLVEDAYGLSLEERELMRATRPVRDPLDVLEARVAGKAAVEGGGGGNGIMSDE